MKWEPVIGLEVHVQLSTASKIFSGSSTTYGASPNSQASAVDLALPGTLPVLNEKAIAAAIKFGLAIDATIANETVFDRKNYFYPDLPKGYQISQLEHPIVSGGYLDILDEQQHTKRIPITRAHLEEDAGKSIHDAFSNYSGIDLNRAGIPLLEVVSEPAMYSAAEAVAYLKSLHALVQYLDICDGNLQEGSFRCDVNISLRPKGTTQLGTRAEIKNINSFRFVERAIRCEIERQSDILDEGGTVHQETRLYDADKDETRSMRSKEEAMDYRYFPDPDLLPVIITPAEIEAIRATLPELPREKQQRYQNELGLSQYDAEVLSNDKDVATYFESCIPLTTASPKIAANWIMGELTAYLNQSALGIVDSPLPPATLATLLDRIQDQTLSNKTAKIVFEALWQQPSKTVESIIAEKNLQQVSDAGAISQLVENIMTQYPTQVAEYRAGNEKIIGFLVGKAMQASEGKANPSTLNQLLREKLSHE